MHILQKNCIFHHIVMCYKQMCQINDGNDDDNDEDDDDHVRLPTHFYLHGTPDWFKLIEFSRNCRITF